MGLIIYLVSPFVLNFDHISEVAEMHARNILRVMVTNMIIIVGILCAGGDTCFSLFLDAGTVWLVGVPLAWIGAFMLRLPVSGVYLLIISEVVVKMGVAFWRFLSRRSITNLAKTVS